MITRTWEESSFDDTEGKPESNHSSEIVDSSDDDGDGAPGNHERWQKDGGFRSGEQHVGWDFEHEVRLGLVSAAQPVKDYAELTYHKEDGQNQRIIRGREVQVFLHTTDFGVLSPSAWLTCSTWVFTHSDIGSIDVVHDIHDPEHGKQMGIDLSHKSLFCVGAGHIGGTIGENRLDTTASGLDEVMVDLVI